MSKRLAAVEMSKQIGESFDAIVTGVTPHGTFVRVLKKVYWHRDIRGWMWEISCG
jgi:exoribonuclease R